MWTSSNTNYVWWLSSSQTPVLFSWLTSTLSNLGTSTYQNEYIPCDLWWLLGPVLQKNSVQNLVWCVCLGQETTFLRPLFHNTCMVKKSLIGELTFTHCDQKDWFISVLKTSWKPLPAGHAHINMDVCLILLRSGSYLSIYFGMHSTPPSLNAKILEQAVVSLFINFSVLGFWAINQCLYYICTQYT